MFCFCLLLADLAVWNKSLSQRWRKLRRRCASFTTPSGGGGCSSNGGGGGCDVSSGVERLLDSKSPRVIPRGGATATTATTNTTTHADSLPATHAQHNHHHHQHHHRFPDMQQLLRSKLNRLHAGLRKRRAVSVHEVPSNNNNNYNNNTGRDSILFFSFFYFISSEIQLLRFSTNFNIIL